MSFIRILLAAAVASLALAGQAAAIPSFSSPLQPALDPFGGFDYDKRGAALIQATGAAPTPASPAGSTFNYNLSYLATAVTIVNTSSIPFPGSNLNSTYEISIFATMNETITCVTLGCTVIFGSINSGTYNIFYDPSQNANYAAGTGFADGTVIISGNILPGVSTSLFSGGSPSTSGGGSANLVGSVTTTNPLFINPALIGTVAGATLQFGTLTTDWTRPANFNGMGNCGGTDTTACFITQADGNQSFSTVPEPASLALMGLGVLALGALHRRRKTS